jgi:hypothetical protein
MIRTLTSSSDPGSNLDQSRVPTGTPTGIVVGVVICLLFIIGVILSFVFRFRNSDSSDASEMSEALSISITETTSTEEFEAHVYDTPLTNLSHPAVFVGTEDELDLKQRTKPNTPSLS